MIPVRGRSHRSIAAGLAAACLIALPVFQTIIIGGSKSHFQGQSQPLSQSSKFEVASIKRCEAPPSPPGGAGARGAVNTGGGGNGIRFSADRIVLQCVRMRMVILNAYLEYATGKPRPIESVTGKTYAVVSDRRWATPIEGTPPWLTSELYTIEAKAESSQPPEMLQGPMMQSLLEDRLKLKIRRAMRDTPVYALVLAKGGPKLQPAKSGNCVNLRQPGSVSPGVSVLCQEFLTFGGRGTFSLQQTMRGFAEGLSWYLDRDVIDRTAITGTYDLQFGETDLFRPPAAGSPGNPPGAFKGILDALGLALESTTASMEWISIERIERPSEN